MTKVLPSNAYVILTERGNPMTKVLPSNAYVILTERGNPMTKALPSNAYVIYIIHTLYIIDTDTHDILAR